jgi:hypothetical protein
MKNIIALSILLVFGGSGTLPAKQRYDAGIGKNHDSPKSIMIRPPNVAGGTWTSPKAITLTGTNQPRTSASYSAVSSLQAKGVTVTTTP